MPPKSVRLSIRVVMAIVAVLAVVFWYVADARRREQRLLSITRLRQIGLALHNYESANGAFPTGTLVNPGLPPEKRLGWRMLAYGMLEQFPCGPEFDRSEGWESPRNLAALSDRDCTDMDGKTFRASFGGQNSFTSPFLTTPAKPQYPLPSPTVGIAGLGTDAVTLRRTHPRAGVFSYDQATRFADIVDGMSNTMMVTQTSRDLGPWTAGGPASVRGLDPDRPPYLGSNAQFGGIYPSGAHLLMVDGSVKWAKATMDPKVFESLSTIAGAETIPVETFSARESAPRTQTAAFWPR